jgi:hypothetical protein
MRYIELAMAAIHAADAETRYQQHLRISQNARAIALAARREAIRGFWAYLANSLRNIGHHASVRLGAGHSVTRMEVS